MSLALPQYAGALARRLGLAGAPVPATGAGEVELRTRAQRKADAWNRRCDLWLQSRTRADLRFRWREACIRLGLGQNVVTALGGNGTGRVPIVEMVYEGDPVTGANPYMIVRMPPGLVVADLEEVAADLAESMGAWRLRFTPRPDPFLRVDLIDTDPLERVVPYLPVHPDGHLVFGIDEYGATVSVPLAELTHTIAQGRTRSGKSAWVYGFIAQLLGAEHVRIAGIDPTNLLFRPMPPDPMRAGGTADAADRYAAAMACVVDEMDRRIANLPARRDTVEVGPEVPQIVVVLEEWAGVGRILGHTRAKPSQTHKLVARLLAEGAKAAIRVVILVQRGEADVLGAYEREQLSTALTFGSATPDTLKMVHPWPIDDAVIEAQTVAPQGCALINGPGLAVTRIRAPWIGGYGSYVDHVTACLPGAGDHAA